MTTDPFDRLRDSNPVPYGGCAPPLENVLERIRAEDLNRRRWPASTGALAPLLGAAAAIAVVAVALVLVGHRGVVSRSGPAATSSAPTAPSSALGAPAGGMLGLVFLEGAAFSSASTGLISLQQCLGCHNGNPTAHASYRDWLTSSTDGGASWVVSRRPWYVFNPRFSGSNGWAEGLQARSNAALFYVTHDDGRSWSVAPSAASAMGDQNLSVGAGEVWAVGSNCAAQCTVTVLHAPVSASRLVAAPTQPVSGGWTNVQAVAAGPHTAFVTNPDAVGQTFVTHDDGRSWQRTSPPCPRGAYGRLATGGLADSLWATCQPRHGGATFRRSSDGGRSWHVLSGRFSDVFQLQPVSAQVAWGLTPRGAVVRTTDSGSTWSTVWSVALSQPASLTSRPPLLVALASGTPMLTAQNATSASLVMILTRGHVGRQARSTNLVVYRTSDGGATWRPSVVRLPER